ncbi:hypothetical protein [Pinisolibacter aquiterrae]|uniref:hypothetical protein n=1 Tax=Pinisolibacter aquiterrae TaxID=2815579 RepID=UPI001C3E7A74|nr:hypothetical protein [Pinisolibacter aquiterrae]MBV5266535.1 hypothetical protein [Pinisolibacter aquiterrae]MCC8235205.1 hypothetical protein [Pinisolibacter aquiterrae]
MIYLRDNISRIEKLLSDNSISSTTYAALEARLALERVCYDRLQISHDYISHDEIKKWQPKDVVQKLIQEVDESVASEFTLFISKEPAEDREMTREEYENLEFIPVGTQSGFSPRKIGSLWNALSRLALHVHLPDSKDKSVSEYGDNDEIRKKISEVIVELNRISSGNLISSGLGPEVHFTCECGQANKRRQRFLSAGKILHCINPNCNETYTVEMDGDEFLFARRFVDIKCKCGRDLKMQKKTILSIGHDQYGKIICDACERDIYVEWRLVQIQR